MKAFLLALVNSIIAITCLSQGNVGIGTSAPQAKLDVRGDFRAGGTSATGRFLYYDSATGFFVWNNSSLLTTSNQNIISHSASAEGLSYSNQQLEYRYQDGTPRFFTNWNTGNGYIYGNLGVGQASPGVPIHIRSYPGPKIILSGEDNNYNYGFDNQSYRIQIHSDGGTPGSPSSVSFGYGSSNNFIEAMRVSSDSAVGIGTMSPQAALDLRKLPGVPTANFRGTQHISHFSYGASEDTYLRGGKNSSKVMLLCDPFNGSVGIGINPVPIDGILDVGGRMLIRGGSTSAGVWFNKSDNSAGAAFMGMENDTYVGFYGNNGSGWAFSMNAQNGALKINGSTGTAGKVLQSNGNGSSPSWVSSSNSLYNNTLMLSSTSSVTIPYTDYAPGPERDIPGFSYTFTPTSSGRFVVHYTVIASIPSPCASVAYAPGGFYIVLYGADEGRLINSHGFGSCGRTTDFSGVFQGSFTSGAPVTLKLSAQTFNTYDGITVSCNCAASNVMIIQLYYK